MDKIKGKSAKKKSKKGVRKKKGPCTFIEKDM